MLVAISRLKPNAHTSSHSAIKKRKKHIVSTASIWKSIQLLAKQVVYVYRMTLCIVHYEWPVHYCQANRSVGRLLLLFFVAVWSHTRTLSLECRTSPSLGRFVFLSVCNGGLASQLASNTTKNGVSLSPVATSISPL